MSLDNFSDNDVPPIEQAGRRTLSEDAAADSIKSAPPKSRTDASPEAVTSYDDMAADDARDSEFSNSLASKHYDSLAESLKKIDPNQENPFALQGAQLTLGILNGFGNRLDNFGNPDTRTEALAETGFGVASAIGISWGLTKLAYSKASRAPEIGRALSRGFKYAFLADVALEVGQTIYEGIDTWRHPDHYLANSDAVAGSLGSSLFDFTTLGGASLIGFEAGETTFGLRSLKSTFASFSRKTTEDIPRIEFNAFRGLPKTVAEPTGTEIANMYTAQVPGVVRVNTASGLIVDGEEGLIASNAHVAQGKSRHYATTSDGQRFDLKLIARDKDADIAIFQTIKPPEAPLRQVTLAESSNLPPGSETFLISHPMFSPKALIATQASDGYELAKALAPARTAPRPIAYNRGFGTGAPGSSGGPLFNKAGEVVAQNSRSDVAANFRSGPSVEHLNEVLRQIREHQPYEGVLDVKTAAQTSKDEAGKLSVALPIRVTSTANVLTREGLARKAQQRWTPPKDRYPRSQDLGKFRLFALPSAVDIYKTILRPDTSTATTSSDTTDDSKSLK